jgi:hypothetical protein
MKKIVRLNETQLSRLIRKVIREQEETVFDIEKTIKGTGAFSDDDIPVECKHNDELTPLEMINACNTVVKTKSDNLQKTISALGELLTAANERKNEIQTESRRNRRSFYYR